MQLLIREETKDSVQDYQQQQKKKGLRTNDVNFICGQEKCLKGVVRVLKVKARLVNIHNTLLVNTIVLVVITT
jgi:hypothetical protein